MTAGQRPSNWRRQSCQTLPWQPVSSLSTLYYEPVQGQTSHILPQNSDLRLELHHPPARPGRRQEYVLSNDLVAHPLCRNYPLPSLLCSVRPTSSLSMGPVDFHPDLLEPSH